MACAPTLSGPLATVREIDVERDTRPFHEMFLDPDMHVWTGNRVPASLDESRAELERYRSLPGLVAWAVTDTETGAFVGTYWVAAPVAEDGLRVVTAEAQRIAKPHWRRGYTREARRLVYDWLFGELGVDVVRAQAWQGNRSSCLSMEHAGFRLRRVRRRHFGKRDEVLPECEYELDRASWRSQGPDRPALAWREPG